MRSEILLSPLLRSEHLAHVLAGFDHQFHTLMYQRPDCGNLLIVALQVVSSSSIHGPVFSCTNAIDFSRF
jgi:hypothetical protein